MGQTITGKARYRRIVFFAAVQLSQTWWFDLFLPRLGLSGLAQRGRAARMRRFARRFRALAVELGGLMIKVGQYMSTRMDVLPPEITLELKGLQDEVPAVPFEQISAAAERELGGKLSSIFAWVDPVPLAAASLGQVHRARLGESDAQDTGIVNAVIKVQRPGIDEIVAIDLQALRKVGGWLNRIKFVSSRANVPGLVEEFAQTCHEEIDYLHEAANSVKFADEFADNPHVRVPEIIWERSTKRVLTLEDVSAIKVADHQGLKAAGIDPAEVAPVFAEIMFQQLFTTGFFHADPHPGNIFVTPGSDASWTLTFIDFGMMGQVPANTRAGFRKAILAAVAHDGKGIVEAIDELGVLIPGADTAGLERAMTALFARFGGMGFAELSKVDPNDYKAFAAEFGDVVRQLPFQMPENFLLIFRAMSLTSGLCSTLDPEFNLWDSAEPFAAALLKEQSGNVVQDVAKQAVDVARITVGLPKRVDSLITQIEDGSLNVSIPRLEKQIAGITKAARAAGAALIFAALLIAGAIVRPGDLGLSNVLMIASAVPLLMAVFGGRRR